MEGKEELAYYREIVKKFRLEVPKKFSFVLDVFDKWGKRPALIWTDGKEIKRFTFEELTKLSSKLAGGFKEKGINKGDKVLILLPNIVEWWISVLALMRLGAIIIPATVLLTSKDLEYRLSVADIKAIISDNENAPKVEEAVNNTGKDVLLVNVDERKGWENFYKLIQKDTFLGERFNSDDPSFIFFTSGTTGPPKMVLHTQVSYPLAHLITGKFWLNLKPGDIHWTITDTGWGKCAWSSLFAPWNMGATVFVRKREKNFSPQILIDTLKNFEVTSFCAPPTVYRMLIKEVPPKELSFPFVKHFVSAGEPLNPEVIDLWKELTGEYIYNGYGQTETVNTIAMFRFIPMRQGAMGLPTPGFTIEIVDEEGRLVKPYEDGEIAIKIKPERPVGLFKEYINDEKEMKEAFRGDWYFTRDRGYKDEDGYFWFLGRTDDIIISSGYRISPFEVESALIKHPAVKESAVVASPDEVRGEVVKAFIVLKRGYKPTEELKKELQEFVKKETAPYKYPRKIEFVKDLPKTISGKIKRKELKLKEFGYKI